MAQREIYPKINFIVTNPRLHKTKKVKVYNGRGDFEKWIEDENNILRGARPAATGSEPISPASKWGH
jgi:hypothetical protein